MHCAIACDTGHRTKIRIRLCSHSLALECRGGIHMRKIILFAAGFAAGVVLLIATWIGVGTVPPTSALAGSTAVDPFAMTTGVKDLPTSHYDDYSVVFVGP
jgi:hypothetical protein